MGPLIACEVVTRVEPRDLALAYSDLDGDGRYGPGDVLISRVLDSNGDGSVSAGDTIEHVWLRDGVRQGSIALKIGGPHWRTQSRWSLRQGSAGRWTVEARDAEGRVLATSAFTCLPAD